VFVNMIALGRLLSIIGIKIEKVDFERELHSRFLEENTRAVKYGYTYKD
jgi:2-oxoglutarate ferredoxin oxidoreductase subunit gamma